MGDQRERKPDAERDEQRADAAAHESANRIGELVAPMRLEIAFLSALRRGRHIFPR